MMFARNRMRVLSWIPVSLAALLLTVDTGLTQATQQVMQQITLPAGMTLRPGWVVTNPFSSGPMILDPASSQDRRPGYMHTHLKVVVPRTGYPDVVQQNTVGPPATGYLAETPASLACVYQTGLGGVDAGKGCDPNLVTALPTGGTGAIAIVDAFDYPTAAADLAVFDTQFGVAAPNFTVIFGTGNPASGCVSGAQPPGDGGNGWNIESSLDIEMAHAMAPNAKIYLVEANSASNSDIANAVAVATKCVQAAGGGYVSMSFGESEFSGETANDSNFIQTNVIYVASAGDNAGTEWPCVSPNVICIGGTTISRKGDGTFLSESTWNNGPADSTGGGKSKFEPRPAYQDFMSALLGTTRGVPDMAAVANPNSGVWIYNSQAEWGGWHYVGGTSAAAPIIAGLLDRAGFIWSNSFNALTNIYSLGQAGSLGPYVTNITSGTCGEASLAGTYPNAVNPNLDPAAEQAAHGTHWSLCAGWGTPKDSGNPNAGIVTAIKGR